MSLLAALLMLAQAAQVLPAIGAAKNASAQISEAQKKNSEALEPPPSPSTAARPAPATSAPPAAVAPSGAPAPEAAAVPTAPGQTPEAAQGGYTYDPTGRRDPFVSLLNGGAATRPNGASRPPGLGGLLVGEVSVKGVLKARGGFVAILQSPDTKTYLAHAGDKVMDGSVKSIMQDAVVFSQEVNDPLSLVKQREVRKTIRPETR
jgi:type IV pilus assembly protein PilP